MTAGLRVPCQRVVDSPQMPFRMHITKLLSVAENGEGNREEICIPDNFEWCVKPSPTKDSLKFDIMLYINEKKKLDLGGVRGKEFGNARKLSITLMAHMHRTVRTQTQQFTSVIVQVLLLFVFFFVALERVKSCFFCNIIKTMIYCSVFSQYLKVFMQDVYLSVHMIILLLTSIKLTGPLTTILHFMM